MWIDLDLEVDPNLNFERAHELATNFETTLRTELAKEELSVPIADINVHIEPRSNESVHGTPMDSGKAKGYIKKITSIEQELNGSSGSHNIELHEMNGRVYLSFHLLINKGISIAEVHDIAEELESRLRSEFPELGRVVIHTEPR